MRKPHISYKVRWKNLLRKCGIEKLQEKVMYLEMRSRYWEKMVLKYLKKLINTIYETGQWPKDFIEVTMIALKKTQATKCSEYCTINLIAHITKIITKILRRHPTELQYHRILPVRR
jgi:hypothetical protein